MTDKQVEYLGFVAIFFISTFVTASPLVGFIAVCIWSMFT